MTHDVAVSRNPHLGTEVSMILDEEAGFNVKLNYGSMQVHSDAELLVFETLGRYLLSIKFKDHKTLIEALEEALEDARRMK
jgi:hypothetical protein